MTRCAACRWDRADVDDALAHAVLDETGEQGIGRPGETQVDDVSMCGDRGLECLGQREAVAGSLGDVSPQRPAGFERDQARLGSDSEQTLAAGGGRRDHAGDLRAVAVGREVVRAPADEVEACHHAAIEIGMAVVHACVDDGDPNGSSLREPMRLQHAELTQIALQREVGSTVGRRRLRARARSLRTADGARARDGLGRELVERLYGLDARIALEARDQR